MIRRILHVLSIPVIHLFKPVKLFAWSTRWRGLGRFLVALTTPMDFLLVWLNIQNETMLLHWRAYRGNFIFGRGIMITDHASTAAAIAQPAMRGNNFMGVNIVASDCSAFATNSGILNQCPPIRECTRGYLDRHVFTPEVLAHGLESLRGLCAGILDDWRHEPDMATTLAIRGTATRLFLRILGGKTIPREDAHAVTRAYIRRFVELSLFSGYLPFVLDALGTHKRVRQDAYFRLKEQGIDLMTIDITLFAAMFSIGTLVLRCIEDTRRFGVDYRGLDVERKRRFVTEAVRLYPTVTSVHRILERPETVRVGGRDLHLTPGDELVYPFVCSNRDPAVFPEPEKLDLERPPDAYEKVLSWSKGPHACPAKELSILVTILMLDALSARFDLEKLRICNPAF